MEHEPTKEELYLRGVVSFALRNYWHKFVIEYTAQFARWEYSITINRKFNIRVVKGLLATEMELAERELKDQCLAILTDKSGGPSFE